MNRTELENYISETFGTAGEQLFAKYPSFRVNSAPRATSARTFSHTITGK